MPPPEPRARRARAMYHTDPTSFLSVCSGIEAASVAWPPLGWRAAAVSEIDPLPCHVLAHRHDAGPPLFMPDQEASGLGLKERRARAAAIHKLGDLLANSPILPDERGAKLRAIVGHQVMPYFTDERLGQVLLAAVINGLLFERTLICAALDGRAQAPEAPCPEQSLTAIWEAHECGATWK